MSNAPKPLGLSSFKPRGAAEARAEREPSEIDPRGAGEMDRVSERNFVRPDVEPFERERWPSREPLNEAQINIRAQREDIERFKRLCRDDRRKQGDMLRILLDRFEGKGR